jgi:hypothetical protein
MREVLSDDRQYRVESWLGNRCYELEHQPALERAVSNVVARLPEEVLDVLENERDTFIVFPQRHSNSIQRVDTTCPPSAQFTKHETWMVVLASYLLDASYARVVGTVVHELAHVYLQQTSGDDQVEEEADRLASAWGFAEEIEASKLAENLAAPSDVCSEGAPSC